MCIRQPALQSNNTPPHSPFHLRLAPQGQHDAVLNATTRVDGVDCLKVATRAQCVCGGILKISEGKRLSDFPRVYALHTPRSHGE